MSIQFDKDKERSQIGNCGGCMKHLDPIYIKPLPISKDVYVARRLVNICCLDFSQRTGFFHMLLLSLPLMIIKVSPFSNQEFTSTGLIQWDRP